MWGTWTGNNPAQQWVQYTWDQPVRVAGSQIEFWNDQPQGTGVGVAAPASWRIQYWDAADGGAWVDVRDPSGYGTGTNGFQETTFEPVTTTQVRAVLDASTNGSTYSAVAVEEWKVLAEQPAAVEPPGATVEVGETDLPRTVPVTYPDGETLHVPAFWDAVGADDVVAPGAFTVDGSVLGYAGGRVTTDVTVVPAEPAPGDETPPTLTLTPLGSAGSGGWFRSDVRVRVDGTDDSGGRVVLTTRVDDGAPVVTDPVRTAEVAVAGDGEHRVVATAADRAGNLSEEVSLDVRIDRVAPVSSGVLDAAARTVTVTATDATSGVARVEYAIGTGAWRTYDGPVAAPDTNQHRVSFRAVDAAGNAETPKVVTVPADVSGPLTGNVASIATASASYTAGWNSVGALNDGADPANRARPRSGARGRDAPGHPVGPVRLVPARPPHGRRAEVLAGLEPGHRGRRRPPRRVGARVLGRGGAGVGSGGEPLRVRHEHDRLQHGRLRPGHHVAAAGDVHGERQRQHVLRRRGHGVARVRGRPGHGRPRAGPPRHGDGAAALPRREGVRRGRREPRARRPGRPGRRDPPTARAVPAVAPGRSAYQSFAVRAADVPAGGVVVRAAATVDGVAVTSETTAEHTGLGCGRQ